MSTGQTPDSKKTRYGKIPDFERASSELDENSLGNLVKDISEHEGSTYGTAQEVARAFYAEENEKYNRNQLEIRETAKENVDKFEQPDWAWDLLSVYSQDFGKKILDIPSDGSNKGLIVDEDKEKAFLYSKKANGISAVEHVRTWYDNAMNAKSIGYELPSDTVERSCLSLEGEQEPVLEMDYNEEMVLDSQVDEYIEEELEDGEGDDLDQRLESWLKDANPSKRKMKRKEGDVINWEVGLEFLIENNYLETWGIEEFRYGKDNTAIDPDTLDRILVDVGEITEEQDDETVQQNYEPQITSKSPNQSSVPEEENTGRSWSY